VSTLVTAQFCLFFYFFISPPPVGPERRMRISIKAVRWPPQDQRAKNAKNVAVNITMSRTMSI
jgi:hypothetical protein